MENKGGKIFILSKIVNRPMPIKYIAFLGTRSLTVGLQFICVFLLVRYVQPTVYGQFSLVLTIPVITNQLMFGPLSNAILRYLPQAKTRFEKTGLFASSITLTIVSMIGVVLFYIVIGEVGAWELLSRNSGAARVHDIGLIGLFLTGSSGLSLVMATTILGFKKRVRYGLTGLIDTSSKLGAYLLLARIGALNIYTLVSATLFGQVMSIVFVGCCLGQTRKEWLSWRGIRNAQERFIGYVYSWNKELGKFSLVFVGWGTLGWMQAISEKWFLTFANRIDELGIYSLALQISYAPAAILLGATTQYVLPNIYQQSKKNLGSGKINEWLRGNTFTIAILSALIASYVVSKVGDIFFKVGLINAQYEGAVVLMAPLFISACLFFLGEVIKEELIVTKRRYLLTIVKFIYFLVAVVLNWIACWFFPLEIVAWFNALSSLIYVCLIRLSVNTR